MVCLFVCEEWIENIFDLDTWDWSNQTHKLILNHLQEGTVCLRLPRKCSLDVMSINPEQKGRVRRISIKRIACVLRIKRLFYHTLALVTYIIIEN